MTDMTPEQALLALYERASQNLTESVTGLRYSYESNRGTASLETAVG